MLFSLYPLITQNYFILAFAASLGALQWAAARNRLLVISLLGPWGLSQWGAVLGLGLAGGSLAWFFAFTPGLFQPGLAGGELSTLFGAGSLCALLLTRLAGLLWQRQTADGRRRPWAETLPIKPD